MGMEVKNPGALAGATEVNSHKKAANFPGDHTPGKRKSAMSKWAKGTHKQAARMVGYALTLGTADAWHGVSYVLAKRLSEAERAALAYAALQSLDDDTAYMTASVALFGTLHGEVVA